MVRGLELPPALVRAYAVENFFDVALVVGTEKLPGAWVGVGVGYVRKALFASPEVAKKLGAGAGRSQAHRRAAVRDADLQRQRAVRARRRRLPARRTRTAGSATSRRRCVVGLDLARSTGQLIFGPAIAAHAHVARGELAEVRVRGWEVSEPLTLAVNGERVRRGRRRRWRRSSRARSKS